MFVRLHRQPVPAPVLDRVFNFEGELDSLFGELMGTGTPRVQGQYPALDLVDSREELLLTAELPGVRKEDLRLVVQDGVLTVSGTRKGIEKPEGAAWVRNERWSGSFSRSIELPQEIDAARISAELENGILRVTLPKAESAKPREIAIR